MTLTDFLLGIMLGGSLTITGLGLLGFMAGRRKLIYTTADLPKNLWDDDPKLQSR